MAEMEASEEALNIAASTRRKLRAASTSIGINIGLVAIEALVAIATGSLGVLADSGHSGFDLVASLFAFWGIRTASAPPDPSHHYGHEKYENFSSLVQMAMLIGIAAFVVGDVVWRLFSGFDLEVGPAALAVIGATLVVDFWATRYLGRVALEEQSFALEADSYHFLTDMWTKVAVLVGLVAASLGQIWLDPAAAVVVACFMLATAFRLGRRSTRVLLDAAPHSDVVESVRRIVAEEAGESGFHSLRLRQAGKSVYLDLSLHVPAAMSVGEAHERAHRLSRRLCDEVRAVREAVIHVEPAEEHGHLEGEHSGGSDSNPDSQFSS